MQHFLYQKADALVVKVTRHCASYGDSHFFLQNNKFLVRSRPVDGAQRTALLLLGKLLD